MIINLKNLSSGEIFYVSTVHFESMTEPLGGFLWTTGPVPPLGDYLLTPFDYQVRLTAPQGGDNHIKFHCLTPA
jgi:hypothetical protein